MILQTSTPPFRVFETLFSGMRYVGGNLKVLSMLSLVPFVVGAASYLLARGVDPASFWVPIFQFPMYFMIGLQTAAIMRFMVLGEVPRDLKDDVRKERNTTMVQAAGVYGAVQFLFAGLMSGMMMLRDLAATKPEVVAPYMPLMLGVLFLMTWAMRWMWLSVPVSLGWDVRGFFEKLGTWTGSLRVFGLYILCSIIVNAIIMVVWRVVSSGASSGKLEGGYALAADVLLAAGSVGIGVLFAVCTGIAVRQMLGGKVKVDA